MPLATWSSSVQGGQQDRNGLLGRTILGCIDAHDRVRIESGCTQTVHGVGGEGNEPAVLKQFGCTPNVHLGDRPSGTPFSRNPVELDFQEALAICGIPVQVDGGRVECVVGEG